MIPGVILVHCTLGISRSVTVVIAYLVRKYKMKLDDALVMSKSKRKVKPSLNFITQLYIWEQVAAKSLLRHTLLSIFWSVGCILCNEVSISDGVL
jgi:protein-tyrosine phosphatase